MPVFAKFASMPTELSPAELAAESYYDNVDANRLNEALFGGDDIHVGLYGRNAGALDIASACHRMTVAMADRLASLGATAQILDLGSGYGGAARYLARRFSCKVTCVNISAVQNERHRRLNRAGGLQAHIDVVHGSFQNLPATVPGADVVWSQGAFLHSTRREQILDEIGRVLRPGGQVLFTDQMQAEDCPPGALRQVYERLRIDALATPLWYRREFAQRGFQQLEWCELTPELLRHYTAVRSALRLQYDKLSRDVSKVYMDRMLVNLDNWVSAAHAGYLRWGIFHFRKPPAG
jgi:SAM-dependent methyltransferase